MPLTVLDTWFHRAVAAAPGVIPCKVGCTACCHGPFDISSGDAERIAAAVATLPDVVREPLHQRARTNWEAFAALLPGITPTSDLDALPDALLDAACMAMMDAPCPALDAQGACVVHAARPVSCRLMGSGALLPSGEVLENGCPIQNDYPAYAALPPIPLDLPAVEDALELLDLAARQAGWRGTTVAGAILLSEHRHLT